jgi:asparagine synthase (glutamine-hydrolysing)
MKIAVCFGPEGSKGNVAAKRMTDAMVLLPEQEARSWAVSGGAIGRVKTGDRYSRVALEREAPNGSRLLISGVPVSRSGPLDALLAKVVLGDFRAAEKSLSALEGAFAALFWDAPNKKLLVVNDFLGMQPLFMHRRPGMLMLASEMKGIANSGLLEIKPNPAGWAAFFKYGYFISDDTSVQGITRVA